ncbi:hypothetical protein LNP74_03805 [Klebsiella pneumoniae subsp. pneumoniae]|nr:hypothetical protein [Klebsiella pneumoniae subsp. pneumoniae]
MIYRSGTALGRLVMWVMKSCARIGVDVISKPAFPEMSRRPRGAAGEKNFESPKG